MDAWDIDDDRQAPRRPLNGDAEADGEGASVSRQPGTESEGRDGREAGADRNLPASAAETSPAAYQGRGGGGRGGGHRDLLPRPDPPQRRDVTPAAMLPPALLSSGRAGGEFQSDDPPFDLKKYIGVLFKHRWLVLGVMAFVVCVGLVNTLLQTPIYRGSATIEIKREVANLSGLAGVDNRENGASAIEFYQTQYELLKSRALAERIVAKLRLAEQPEFMKTRKSLLSRLKSGFSGSAPAAPTNIQAAQAGAVGRVMGGLSVQPVRNSRVVRVSYDSPSPKFAQEVANGVVTAFIEMSLERNYEASAHARKFLEERLQDLKLKLSDSERKLVSYAEAKDILTTGDDRTLAMANLEEINGALTTASKERLRQELVWRQIQSSNELPQSLETDAVAMLRSKRAELQLTYQEKLKVFKPGYPDMVQLRAQISEIDSQIDKEVARIKESIRLQYQAAVDEQTTLAQRVADLKQDVNNYQERNIDYTILKREVDTNRTLYEGLLQRYKELSVTGGAGNPSNISIVDEAQRPGAPFKPNLKVNLALALMFGALTGGLAAFGREFIDDSFKLPEDVEQELGLPLMGIIPEVEETKYSEQMADPRSPLNEAYRSLRTALQFSTPGGVPKTLLVTSSRPSEGKSSTSFNVARHFALLGMQVLLIDADLRKPSLHRRIGCSGHRGLSNCLVGNARPPEVLQRTDYPNLEFMPAGPLPPDPTELLASARMASLLAIASEKYDLVVIDTAPVGGMADAPILSNFAEGCLLVIEAHKAPRNGVANALKRLHFARADVLGAVLNKFNLKTSGFGYGYGYGTDEYYSYGADEDDREPEAIADERKDA
ncbi:succinoglycan biosynthesis transport protein ExoP [Amorphus suaedae]